MAFSIVDRARAIVYSASGVLGIGTGLGTALITTNPLIGLAVGAGTAGVMAIGGAIGPIRGAKAEANESKINVDVAAKLPGELRSEFEKLDKLYITYKQVENPLTQEMESILTNAQSLFERINSKLDTQAGRLAAVNYTDTLRKLNKALGPEYYLDILQNPNLWDRSEQRIQAVENAVMATNAQLIKQIRQVNASQDIEYELSIDSLIDAAEIAENDEKLIG